MKNRAGGSERNDPGSPLRLELLLRLDLACSSGTRRLFYAEECGRRVLICGGEPNLHLTPIPVKGDAVELVAVEREPQAERRNVDSLPELSRGSTCILPPCSLIFPPKASHPNSGSLAV